MPEFRGNVGNIMQHWVLCELLAVCAEHFKRMVFVDAYTMAPLATERHKEDVTSAQFDRVPARLPGQGTHYENAWLALTRGGTCYPNSAHFVTAVWPGAYGLLLCEIDRVTALEIDRWARLVRAFPRCEGIEVSAPRDWRERFAAGLAFDSDLTFLSFDPYLFSRHGASELGQMGPEDLALVGKAVTRTAGPILIQLSTYSVNGRNAQRDVEPVVTSWLREARFELLGLVKANHAMMSLVYGRDVGQILSVATLESQFRAWLARAVRPESPSTEF